MHPSASAESLETLGILYGTMDDALDTLDGTDHPTHFSSLMGPPRASSPHTQGRMPYIDVCIDDGHGTLISIDSFNIHFGNDLKDARGQEELLDTLKSHLAALDRDRADGDETDAVGVIAIGSNFRVSSFFTSVTPDHTILDMTEFSKYITTRDIAMMSIAVSGHHHVILACTPSLIIPTVFERLGIRTTLAGSGVAVRVSSTDGTLSPVMYNALFDASSAILVTGSSFVPITPMASIRPVVDPSVVVIDQFSQAREALRKCTTHETRCIFIRGMMCSVDAAMVQSAGYVEYFLAVLAEDPEPTLSMNILCDQTTWTAMVSWMHIYCHTTTSLPSSHC